MNDERVGPGPRLPRIATAVPLDNRRVRITWKTGETQEIDLSPALLSHRGFVRLRTDDELYRTMRVDEYGDALVWADGVELNADWIKRLAPFSLSNKEFREAMDDLQMSLDGMAVRLGIARRLIAEYRKDRPIPPYIALATRQLVEVEKKAS
jgi:hypothetical protein